MGPISSLLVSPAELHHLLKAASTAFRIVPVAAGNHSTLPSFESRHVPNSVFFNMDAVKDTNSPYPMMLPSSAQFATYMAERGIRRDDVLVIYDTFETGLRLSPRVAWTCQHFGHKNVHVLNNFANYVKEGFPVASGQMRTPVSSTTSEMDEATSIDPDPEADNVITFEHLRCMVKDPSQKGKFQIIDARPNDLFSGRAAANGASASVRLGHMPSAINVPFDSVLGLDKTFLPPAELRDQFVKWRVREDVPAVLTCNSGVTAAVVDLALRVAGLNVKTSLYDGSWSEWADRVDEDGLIVI
ncbi:hypothetical protein CBS63078_2300 [Aspergillus niger]|nr:thiosulfate sulfurtransferase [Aspergillus niger CBS 101883]KAI2831996.1 hypothetical protein CBS133816_1873 [Aspergillus niger]KAI2844352.1 hypothetical protein CBS11350_4783 [Aspergillus niger]KAI2864892.1 hypothetical protein CBS12448_2519 [Aspergillus niger]KAI2884062.1 hypothetical protein CBS13152_8125 [Aspergillus niger]KAI2899696.1 hypothetical protein CBS11852_3263 [Aspergillus niger]